MAKKSGYKKGSCGVKSHTRKKKKGGTTKVKAHRRKTKGK